MTCQLIGSLVIPPEVYLPGVSSILHRISLEGSIPSLVEVCRVKDKLSPSVINIEIVSLHRLWTRKYGKPTIV